MAMRILMQNDCVDVSESEFTKVIASLNVQLKRDFLPIWGIEARLEIMKKKTTVLAAKADGIIYLKDAPPSDGYMGYHDLQESNGMPYGYTFQDVAAKLGEPWSVTMSHEVLELVLNRHCNYYAKGPHPKGLKRDVFYWMEACDAVQDQTYFIGTVEVSDFVTPHYFTPNNEPGIPNNFLSKNPVKSFGITEGGYCGYFDPKTGKEETMTRSEKAKARYAAKASMGEFRRSRD